MDILGIYRKSEAWLAKKLLFLTQAKEAKSLKEAHKLLREALQVVGGKHSALEYVARYSGECVKTHNP